MQDEDEDAETLRRIDALGDASLSQAPREALARRTKQQVSQQEDEWIPDLRNGRTLSLEALNIKDEATCRKIVPPFALLQLNTDVRRKVLAFLICASQDHALQAIAAVRVPEKHRSRVWDPDAESSPKVISTGFEVFSSNRVASTVIRGVLPRSTAASVATLFHHTAALHLVCAELRTDAEALASAARSTATPRSWLANLYCRRTLDNAAVVPELRARALSGRRANVVREVFPRKDALTTYTPPGYGRTFTPPILADGHSHRRPRTPLRVGGSNAA